MSQADRIRHFVVENYIAPANAEGRAEITIRAGDIHRAMGLMNSMPSVCQAIASNKFDEIAGTTPLDRTGPANGANVYFRFRLSPLPLPEGPSPVPHHAAIRRADSPKTNCDIDLSNALVLVSCVKSKLPHAAPARVLYTSAWFQKTRDIVEERNARWFILSALYGLVSPDAAIAPYNRTLNTLSVRERRVWAEQVLEKLLPEIVDRKRVVMFAGSRYREFLEEPLRQRGLSVEVPMANLRRGEQLAWLSKVLHSHSDDQR
jgi:hypothetical protein